MTTFQKIATLIFRLFALALIFYAIITGGFAAIAFPFPAILFLFIPLVGGLALYWLSFPLAWYITKDFEKPTSPESSSHRPPVGRPPMALRSPTRTGE